MKIHEVIRLRNVYGGETTLNDLVRATESLSAVTSIHTL